MNAEQLNSAECRCGTVGAWRKVVSTEQTGRKGDQRSRDPTERHVFACRACGREGKVFVDGVNGRTTFSGALRGAT